MQPNGDLRVLTMPGSDRLEQGRVDESRQRRDLEDARLEAGDAVSLAG